MIGVSISGMGWTKIGELWDQSIYDLAEKAGRDALDEAGMPSVDALVVGNMLSGSLSHQENLGACIADRLGITGVESVKVEAACASGAAAVRTGFAMISGGLAQHVLVVGVEKMTDQPPEQVIESLAFANSFETETIVGMTNTSLAALLTSMYVAQAGATLDSLSQFSINAFQKSCSTPWSMFKRSISKEDWSDSPIVSMPLRLLDCPAICDGAAAVVLSSKAAANPLRTRPVEVLAIEGCTDTLSIFERKDPLRFVASEVSCQRALDAASTSLDQIDLFEPHDAFPVMAAISLEAVGLMPVGEGWRYYDVKHASRRLAPIQTLGGIKGKGHPVGASGVYQIIDAVAQIRGRAGPNQLDDVEIAMTQSFGGTASNVYTTILRAGELRA